MTSAVPLSKSRRFILLDMSSPTHAVPGPACYAVLSGLWLASGAAQRLSSSFPGGIRIICFHRASTRIRCLSQIALINHAIAPDDERHHAGRAVLRRIGHESKSLGHLAIYN